MSAHLSRRSLIVTAAALAAARAAAAQGLEPGRSAKIDPFGLGVASGDPSPDGFVLWTRLSAQGEPLEAPAVPVAYEVAEDEGFRRVVRRGRVAASPALAHAVHVEIVGLKPGRPYWYRFQAFGAVSPVGRAVTTPLQADALRIAFTSCQHFELGWFAAYRDMVAAQPDLILQIGDYIYETPVVGAKTVRKFGAPDPTDLATYRARYALYKSDPDLRAAHLIAPWVVTWDDHEVENDYADLNNLEAQPPEVFARRRAGAYQAYVEHMPLRPSLWANPRAPRLYRTLAWGDIATLPVLDGRQYRSNQAGNPPFKSGGRGHKNDPAMDAPDRTMLGAPQEGWLASTLAAEKRPWTLLTQQTVMARIETTEGLISDQWDGYGAARGRLMQSLIRPEVRNPVVLSGDIHAFFVNDMKTDFLDPKAPTVATEIVTACLTGNHASHARHDGDEGRNPHIRYKELDHSGYALLNIGRKAMQIDLRGVADQTDPAAVGISLAKFVVEDGRPGAQAA